MKDKSFEVNGVEMASLATADAGYVYRVGSKLYTVKRIAQAVWLREVLATVGVSEDDAVAITELLFTKGN